jgi:hypothetical protein
MSARPTALAAAQQRKAGGGSTPSPAAPTAEQLELMAAWKEAYELAQKVVNEMENVHLARVDNEELSSFRGKCFVGHLEEWRDRPRTEAKARPEVSLSLRLSVPQLCVSSFSNQHEVYARLSRFYVTALSLLPPALSFSHSCVFLLFSPIDASLTSIPPLLLASRCPFYDSIAPLCMSHFHAFYGPI